MSITEILNNKELSDSEKLEKIGVIVTNARKKYGNLEAEVSSVDVNTVHGSVAFEYLEDASKVELIKNRVISIKQHALELKNQNPAVNKNAEVIKALALDPMLNNIDTGEAFELI